MTDEQIRNGARYLKENGIKLYTQNMVALPNETIDDSFNTIKLNKELNIDYAWVSIFQPYPQTKLGEKAREMGLVDSWDFPESYYYKSVLKIKDREQFERLHNLFPLTAQGIINEGFTRFLIKLPLTELYKIIWNLHRTIIYLKIGYMDLGELVALIKK